MNPAKNSRSHHVTHYDEGDTTESLRSVFNKLNTGPPRASTSTTSGPGTALPVRPTRSSRGRGRYINWNTLGMPPNPGPPMNPNNPMPQRERVPPEPCSVLSRIPRHHLNEFNYPSYDHYGNLKYPLPHSMPAEFFDKTKAVAVDCEMVEIACGAVTLARLSIVNEYGFCLFDSFAKTNSEIVDYKTEFSGVRKEDIDNAPPTREVVEKAKTILKDSIIVGHSLKSDFSVMHYFHPTDDLRDTSLYFRESGGQSPSLKNLIRRHFNVDFQGGEHSSVDDAQAAMCLYMSDRDRWERLLKVSR